MLLEMAEAPARNGFTLLARADVATYLVNP